MGEPDRQRAECVSTQPRQVETSLNNISGHCRSNGLTMGNLIMTDNDAKLITLLENVLEDIMGDLDKKISSHSAMILSNETRFISEQIRHLKGQKNA